MDWTLLILLAALLVTFLAWSRARRQTAEAGEAREAALRSKTYTLEPQETTGAGDSPSLRQMDPASIRRP